MSSKKIILRLFRIQHRFDFQLIVVVVGNEASSTNPLPAKAETKLRVCCGVPTRLSLSLLRPQQNKCPTNVVCILLVVKSFSSYFDLYRNIPSFIQNN